MRGEGWMTARASADSLTELNASTLGVLGVGTIGRRVAAIARDGFGMTILGTSRRKGSLPADVQEVSLDELFTRSHAVVVCCALTDETRGLVNRDLLARMRPSAVLVNVSRGAVIDTPALIDALRSGKIAGATLDVFDVQPLPPDDALFGCPNLLLTPHTAGITATSGRTMAVGSAEEMLRILRGEQPLNLVNPDYKAA
jgi:D-3-phosphoglycerate dehydrogenase / 2-oxoglutarate reductase